MGGKVRESTPRSARVSGESFRVRGSQKRYAARARSRRRGRGGRGSRVNTHHLDRIRSSASPEFLRCRWAVRASAIFYSIFSASVNDQDDRASRPHDHVMSSSAAGQSQRRARSLPEAARSRPVRCPPPCPPVSRRRAGRHPPRAPRRASPRRRARLLRRETVPPARCRDTGCSLPPPRPLRRRARAARRGVRARRREGRARGRTRRTRRTWRTARRRQRVTPRPPPPATTPRRPSVCRSRLSSPRTRAASPRWRRRSRTWAWRA